MDSSNDYFTVKEIENIFGLYNISDVVIGRSASTLEMAVSNGTPSIVFAPIAKKHPTHASRRSLVDMGAALGVFSENGLAKAIETIHLFEDELIAGRFIFLFWDKLAERFGFKPHPIKWDVDWEKRGGILTIREDTNV